MKRRDRICQFQGKGCRRTFEPKANDKYCDVCKKAAKQENRHAHRAKHLQRINETRRKYEVGLRQLVAKGKKAEQILAEAKQLVAKVRTMPHRPAEDERAAYANQLYNQDLKWSAIQKRTEAKFKIHTTIRALRALRSRYLKRQAMKLTA